MNSTRIYEKVKSLVARYKTRDPSELIDAMNINLQYIREDTEILGMYTVIQRNRWIFLSNKIGSMKKEVLAHELGHDQLHRDECKNCLGFHEHTLYMNVGRHELEANIFASHLLISDSDVIEALEDGLGYEQMAYRFGVSIDLVLIKIKELNKLDIIDIDPNCVCEANACYLKNIAPPDDDEWYIC